VLAIDKWNTDSVEEFLKTHLVSDNEDNSDFLKTNMVWELIGNCIRFEAFMATRIYKMFADC